MGCAGRRRRRAAAAGHRRTAWIAAAPREWPEMGWDSYAAAQRCMVDAGGVARVWAAAVAAHCHSDTAHHLDAGPDHHRPQWAAAVAGPT